jgi:hypothetical protein
MLPPCARVPLAVLALAACGPVASPAREVYPMADAPPPPPSERCYRHRFELRGKPFEYQLRLALDPPAGQVTSRVDEHGGNGDATWTTVMRIDGARFTAVEVGPEGEARGEGMLRGTPWAWSGWQTVLHRADGFDEHADFAFTDDALTVATETRAADGAVASTGQRRYREVACATLTDAPIETLYPKPAP